MIAGIGRTPDIFVAYMRRCGSNHHDLSADQSLKQMVFSCLFSLIAEAKSVGMQAMSPAYRVTFLPVTRRDPPLYPGLNEPIT